MKTLVSSPAEMMSGWAWESARSEYWRARHQHTIAEQAESMARFYRVKLREIGVEMPGI